MHVLGALLKLKSDADLLPLPWWHRAALGLLNDTSVYVSLVESKSRDVGELVVSVIDPNSRRIHLECRRADKPGVLAKVLEAIEPLKTNVNVALAEAVTVESGNLHHVTLVCELPESQSEEQLAELFRSKLNKFKFLDIEVEPYHPLTSLVWSRVGKISHGWVAGVKWRQLLPSRYDDTAIQAQYDLSKAVVTADLDNRVLRYVFPRRGAVTVEIEHADLPGALQLLTQSLGECGLNILSALLRRGGAQARNAILVAVCEPLKDQSSANIKKAIKERISRIEQKYRPDCKINEGRDATETIYARHPDEITARVPESLKPMVLAAKAELPAGLFPVFLSRRFLPPDNPRAGQIVERVRKVLKARGCVPVEALPTPGHHAPAPFQVSSKLWASAAAVVLVINIGTDEAFSMNLAHEYGFMQGQGKPILVLIERGQEESLKRLSNLHGLNIALFAADDVAFGGDDQENSIEQRIASWLSTFK